MEDRGETLRRAVYYGKLETISQFTRADAESCDASGFSALEFALLKRFHDVDYCGVLTALVTIGADVNKCHLSCIGFSVPVLTLAVKNEHIPPEVIKWFIDNGADVNAPERCGDKVYGCALHAAVQTRRPEAWALEILNILLRAPGVSLCVLDDRGRTPLQCAQRGVCQTSLLRALEAACEVRGACEACGTEPCVCFGFF